jgi:MerR family transcriptional regulator, redox-sensitive transcriptional activator SoxR
MTTTWIPIGDLARRAGVAASALRFYEAQGLIHAARTAGGRRQYPRDVLRRVAFIRAAQAVGLSLDDIRQALSGLPGARTPTQADWQRLSRTWQPLLDERIAALTRLRDQLSSCIGCGCLSLRRCALYNPGDAAASRGSGARYLLGDRPASVGTAALPEAQAPRGRRVASGR